VAAKTDIATARRAASRLAREGASEHALSILLSCLVDHPGAIGLARQLRDLSIDTQTEARGHRMARMTQAIAPGNSEFLIPWGNAASVDGSSVGGGGLDPRFWVCAAADESQQVRAAVMLRRFGETARLEKLLARMIERRCAILAREGRPAVRSYLGFIDGLYNFFWGSRVAADKIAALELMERTATPALLNIPDALPSGVASRYRNALEQSLRDPRDRLASRVKAIALEAPGIANLYFGLGEYHNAAGDHAASAGAYRRADVISPGNRFTRHRLAHALANSNRQRDALTCYLVELGMSVRELDAEKLLEGGLVIAEDGGVSPPEASPPRLRAADPKFTFVVCAYKYPEYFAASVEKLLNQTYRNIEIILVNNGAGARIQPIIDAAAARDPRVRPLIYETEQYAKDDPLKFVAVCLNEALAMATGDFIIDLNDDDYVDETYAEKMVALFQGNPNCVAASGGINRIGAKGEYRGNYDFYNTRPTYTPGAFIAFSSFLAGTSKMYRRFLYAAYGLTFAYRREMLSRLGGFHRDTDNSILYGYLPFGLVGIDPSTRFNWRVHEEQLSNRMGGEGHVGLRNSIDFWRHRDPVARMRIFGERFAARFDEATRGYIAEVALGAAISDGPGGYGTLAALRAAALELAPALWGGEALRAFDEAVDRAEDKGG